MAGDLSLGLPKLGLSALPRLGSGRKPKGNAKARRDLLGTLKDATATGFGIVGNAFDVPGSMVRDTLTGNNPFDQLLTPWSDKNRVSGRDMLRKMGLASKKDTTGNFVGGTALEIGLDPLTYLSFGASALGKGGRVARAAGLMGDATRIAAQKAGVQASKIGERTARTSLSLRDLIHAGGMDAARRAATAAKAQGVKLRSIADEKLGGFVGIGAPFRDPKYVLGSGPVGQTLAKAADFTGGLTRFIPGVTLGKRLFNSKLKDASTPEGQAAAKALFSRQERNSARALLNQAHNVRKLDAAGLGGVDKTADVRKMLEDHGSMDKFTADTRKLLADKIQRNKEWGINTREYQDPAVAYFPAHMTDGARGPGVKSNQPFTTMNPNRIGRRDFLYGIPNRTNVLNDLTKDKGLNLLIEKGASRKDLTKYIRKTFGAKIPASYVPKAGGKPVNRYKRLARWVAKMPTDVRQSGVFANHPIADLAKYERASDDAFSAAQTVLETLAQPGILKAASKAARVEGSETVASVLGKLDLFKGDAAQGAMTKLMELQHGPGWKGIAAGDPKVANQMLRGIAEMRIDSKLAGDLTRIVQGFTSPAAVSDVMKGIDSATNLTKGWLTGPWPAFHMRNLTSGQFQNWIAGMFSVGSVKGAHQVLRGKALKGASKIPALRRMAAERGITKFDDAEATKLLRELAAGYRITGKGELDNIVGAGAARPTTIDDVRMGMPGEIPQSFGRFAKKLLSPRSLNPFDVRGVGGRTESRFAPAAAGDEIGYYVEGMNRLAPFIEQLRKGVDPAEAAMRIGAAQVNYQAKYYTKAEQEVLGRLFPFFKFTKGQVPFTLQQLVEKPGGRLAQTVRAVNRGRNPDEFTPDHVAGSASVPLGKLKDGSARYLTGFGLGVEDPLSLVGGPRSAGLEFLSRLNPIVKAPLEYFTGESFFQKGPEGGRNLSDMDPTIGRLLANINGKKQPVRFAGSQLLDVIANNSPLSRVLSTARVATDSRKGPLAKLANLGSGFKVSDVSPGAQDAVLRERAQDLEKQLGFQEFIRLHLPKDRRKSLDPTERRMADALSFLDRELALRAKKRKKNKKKR